MQWREKIAKVKRTAYLNKDYWGKPVPGFGDDLAKIMIVGLAPGAHGANRTGRVFTGDASGQWLYSSLFRNGLASQPNSDSVDDSMELFGVYITCPVKCVPPENKPTIEERDNCYPYFEREIDCLDPTVFVALGKFAFDIIQRKYNIKPRKKFSHGLEVDLGNKKYLVASYHVSQQNTSTYKLTKDMLDNIFVRAKKLAGYL